MLLSDNILDYAIILKTYIRLCNFDHLPTKQLAAKRLTGNK